MSVFRRVNLTLIYPLVIKRSKEGDSITLRSNTFKPQRGMLFLRLNKLPKVVTIA